MAEAFIGEIRLFGFNFAPRGWALCYGQTMSIAQNTALFSLLGTTYGGDGQSTFKLPDLRGRVPVGMGQGPGLANVVQGEVAGEANHTLITTEMPAHVHSATTAAPGATNDPATTTRPATSGVGAARGGSYAPVAPSTQAVTVAQQGGSQAHNNLQPYLGMNYAICLEGIFPSRN